MLPLEKELRTKLERTVKEARDIAEAAARSALEHLGVGEANPYGHLNDEERDLRRRLRIHGRQLGDSRDNKTEKQEIDRLVEEIAYEHWHRMLFARFLADNNLLMFPDPDNPVPVTLQECEDLAADEGATNGWELASRFAARMLPQIFRPDSPVFELTLPPETQQALERLLDDLPAEVFTASDSLGWVYQFWQAKRKDEVNASEVKIGARELPAVTQLFTEPYMVSFLLDNSLGAWWAARRLTEDDLMRAESEEELRDKASLPGVPLEYLRFAIDEDGKWTPAAGTFDGWPKHLSELKTLDPCCGSGHFLVSALLMLAPMRIELEGLSAQDAVDAVLRDNIHGLEIDQRCIEIAAFNLALTTWRYPNAGGYRALPDLNVACSGLSISAKKEEWLVLAGDDTNLRSVLEGLYEQFKDAPVLGSLINPEASLGKRSLFELKWDDVGPLLTKALSGEKDNERLEMGVVAKGLVKVADINACKFNLLTTNVPFLTQSKFSPKLKEFIYENHPIAKENLATAFLSRMLKYCSTGSMITFVSPQSWWFLRRYAALRNELILEHSFKLLARLGEKAFESPQAAGEIIGLTLLEWDSSEQKSEIALIDVSSEQNTKEKSEALSIDELSFINQLQQQKNKDHAIYFEEIESENLIGDLATALQGCITGDSYRFLGKFWEQDNASGDWEFLQSTSPTTMHFGGMTDAIYWQKEAGDLAALAEFVKGRNHSAQNWRKGKPNWGKIGVVVSQMGSFPSSLYGGNIYDHNCCAIVPVDSSKVLALWAFCSSDQLETAVKSINQNRKVEVGTLLNVPFDLPHWQKVAAERYPNGLPKPYSDDPTQWIFHGHPCGSVIWDEEQKWTTHGTLRIDRTVLHVAVARLLGYRWPAELDPEMVLADETREWVEKCESLLPHADKDGIVCIPAVRGEAPAADRLLDLLAAAYGDDWAAGKLGELLSQVDHAGKSLETWLREKLFAQHCKLFHNRPFIWHIWDGLRDGFSVLVNYHKLDNKKLETLIYTYLGDWIARQKDDIASGVDGAQERLSAAESLKKRLELILQGETPCDIFVRWKLIEDQPIGWDPDLNDGVRMNIRPFMSIPDVSKKGAGILRDKPNVKWDKDRGKDVESAPWYYDFEGERINDHHLTLEEKHAARAKKRTKS